MKRVVVIGGGAAGFFAALSAKEHHGDHEVVLIEKTASLLSKVKISGGGRCNVTHACFDPKLLCTYYPRGSKELLGPFHQFQPKDTIEWFSQRGVVLKKEEDGRMFPITDSSSTIIACLLQEAKKQKIEIRTCTHIEKIEKIEGCFVLHIKGDQEPLCASSLILATGSSRQGYEWALLFGHTVEPLAPSLFTFNVPTSCLKELSGISFPDVEVSLVDTPFSYRGPLLITHFGFSGPVVLKLSSFGAKYLQKKNYHTEMAINWCPELSCEEIKRKIIDLKSKFPQRSLIAENPFLFPKKLWRRFFIQEKALRDLSLKEIDQLAQQLHKEIFLIEGKTTHKEEFVTCGGVCLKEVNFKTMESRLCPHLFFAGEILDIDGITGGFNFQNAWTTGFIAGKNVK